MNPSIKARYWSLVRACLVEFYAHSNHAAQRKIRGFRAELAELKQQSEDPSATDLIYHEEALTIAGELAGPAHRGVQVPWERYLQLLEQDPLPSKPGLRKFPRPAQQVVELSHASGAVASR